MFYEGFDPSRQPEKIRDRDTFLARLAEPQLPDQSEAQRAATATATTRVLRRHITKG